VSPPIVFESSPIDASFPAHHSTPFFGGTKFLLIVESSFRVLYFPDGFFPAPRGSSFELSALHSRTSEKVFRWPKTHIFPMSVVGFFFAGCAAFLRYQMSLRFKPKAAFLFTLTVFSIFLSMPESKRFKNRCGCSDLAATFIFSLRRYFIGLRK